MKIIFIHYSFLDDGVTRSVFNNIEGLREISSDIEFVLIADSFSNSTPENIAKKTINWNSQDLVSELESLTSDADTVIIENPVVGIYPSATLAFKRFAERNPKKNVIYRIHDFIDDRPHLFKNFFETFPDTISIYPKTDNVTFLTLTGSDKERLETRGLQNVHVLPNSIITKNLLPDRNKSQELRRYLEEKEIIKKDEKILLYPVRVEKRKNIEEALLITKLINNSGEKYRLIVTLPFLKDYGESLRNFAAKFNIPCSIGEVGKFIGFNREPGFSVADLFAISDMVITTSIREGFGFAYVEPWISGKPLIGRKILSVTKDFEASGMDMDHLYESSSIPQIENETERAEILSKIMVDPEKMEEVSKELNISEMKKCAADKIYHNSNIASHNYDHVNVARKLMFYLSPLTCLFIN